MVDVFENIYSILNYETVNKKKVRFTIDKKSDLYVYFFLRGLQLLKEKGVLCFICSNSWLDVGYGKVLQQVFLRLTRIASIYDNSAKRSFSKADVNTTINIFVKDSSVDKTETNRLTKKKDNINTQHTARFIVFKNEFEKSATASDIHNIHSAQNITSNDRWRVYPINQNDLYKNGLDEDLNFEGDKWGGKYLRAPDIFYKFQGKYLSGELISIEPNIGTIKTVSWSRLGKNSEIMIAKKSISDKQKKLQSVLKSPREINSIIFSKENTKYFLIVDDDIKSKLVKANLLWVDIRGEKHLCLLNIDNLFFTHNFHGIDIKKNYEPWLITALLASTIVWLVIEVVGRRSLGGGAVRILTYDLKKTPLLLNPNTLTSKQKNLIKELFFNQLGIRNTQEVFAECGIDKTKPIRSQKPNPLPDRKALDDIIFDALGLTQAEREEVYYSVCELVQNRLNKARSV